MTGVLIKSGNFDTGRLPCADKGKDQCDAEKPKIPASHPEPGERPGTECASQLSEGTNAADNLVLNFWPSECKALRVCCLSHPVWGALSQQPNKPIHPAAKVWISPGLGVCRLQVREGTWRRTVIVLLNEPESLAHTPPRLQKDWQYLPVNGKAFEVLPGKAVELQSDRNCILSCT